MFEKRPGETWIVCRGGRLPCRHLVITPRTGVSMHVRNEVSGEVMTLVGLVGKVHFLIPEHIAIERLRADQLENFNFICTLALAHHSLVVVGLGRDAKHGGPPQRPREGVQVCAHAPRRCAMERRAGKLWLGWRGGERSCGHLVLTAEPGISVCATNRLSGEVMTLVGLAGKIHFLLPEHFAFGRVPSDERDKVDVN